MLVPGLVLLLCLAALAYGIFVHPHLLSKEDKVAMQRLLDRYDTVKQPLHAKDEKEVKIVEMYVYPIRSIRADPVEEVEIGKYGIKYDREIVLVACDNKKILKCNLYFPMTCLKQKLIGNKVEVTTSMPEKLSEAGLPTKLTLDMDLDAEKELGEFMETHRN